MGKDFDVRLDAETDATPAQVWDAIATGPGISTWFIGRTEIDGDTVRTTFGDDWIPTGTITTRDQPHRLAYRSDLAPDGRYIAYEYLIEGRAGAATVLRTVTSGFLPGDDWADEYEAMGYGTTIFFDTLTAYLQHFPGRTGTPITAFGPLDDVTDRLHLLGAGDVYHRDPHTLGYRTTDGLYRFIRGLHGGLVHDHTLFTSTDTWKALLP